jgi:hypothetical protein
LGNGCNNVFSFSGTASESPPEKDVPRPAKFRVQETPGEIEISWRWFTPAHLFMAFFATAWDAFLVFWYTMAFRSGAPWIFKVFPVAHLAVGVGLTYSVLLGFWNRTTIRASREEVSFRSGPLPARRDRVYRAGDLKRVFVAGGGGFQRVSGPFGPGVPTGAGVWRLLGVGRDGEEIPLLGSLNDELHARYLAEKIGAFLSG